MESDNNIKDFFEKRLLDENPGADEWNIPSDDIWDNALPHFPKEKKKKRAFLFFLTGAGILALVMALVFYFSFKTVTSSNKTMATREQAADPIINSKNIPSEIKTEIKSTQAITETAKNKEININSTSSKTNTDLKEKTTNSELNVAVTNLQFQENITNDKMVSTAINLEISPKIILENIEAVEKRNIENSKKEIKNPLSIKQNESLPLASEKKKVIEKELATLPILIPAVIEKNKEIDLVEANIDPIKRKRQLKKWEIGLSHSPFIFNWKNLLKADSLEEGEEINFSINYKNLNLPISRRLGRRWSLSSGIALSQIKACIDYNSNNIIYDANLADPDWTASFREQTNSQYINNSIFEEFNITILPDANLMDGDNLDLVGKIPIQLNFIQVPIILNYHFGKKRLEGLIHTGIYLNYLNERVRNVNFSLLKEGQVIAQSLNIDPYSDHYFAVTPIIGFGAKYHFSDHFNIGVSTKIELFAPPLSRFEIGAYYSF